MRASGHKNNNIFNWKILSFPMSFLELTLTSCEWENAYNKPAQGEDYKDEETEDVSAGPRLLRAFVGGVVVHLVNVNIAIRGTTTHPFWGQRNKSSRLFANHSTSRFVHRQSRKNTWLFFDVNSKMETVSVSSFIVLFMAPSSILNKEWERKQRSLSFIYLQAGLILNRGLKNI